MILFRFRLGIWILTYLKYLFLIAVAERNRSIIVAHDVYHIFVDKGTM